MNVYGPESLSNAVAAICPDIQARIGYPAKRGDERHLWWELSSCILSSQVPYSLAVAAANAIDAEGLLLDKHANSEVMTLRLVKVLSTPLSVQGRNRGYRFPMVRARHIAATHAAVTAEGHSLCTLLDSFHDAVEARTWFVTHAPGIGPKQASMFLRNVGMSYDLAVLDRHVLNYMAALGIYSEMKLSIVSLAQYHRHEIVLRDHAHDFDCPLGLLDWAIWIVMRVASQKMEPVTT